MTRMLWPWGGRGCWDQGLAVAAGDGTLWPAQAHEQRLDWPGVAADGVAVVVGSGEIVFGRDPNAVEQAARELRGVVWLHTGDECLVHDSRALLDRAGVPYRLWMQCSRPARYRGESRTMLMGWQPDCRDLVRPLGGGPLAQRRNDWCFTGQVNNGRRHECAQVLDGMSGGVLRVSAGFAQEVVPRAEHLRLLTDSRIAPCPSGAWSPESFRLYEALEAGALPVCDRRSDKWEPGEATYWRHVLGEEPFPCVDSWDEFPALVRRYQSDPVALQRDANRAGAWWLGYKRRFALDLADDVAALGGDAAPGHAVTVLMPSSPTPSHPSTEMLEDTVARLRAYPELRGAEILLMLDGVRGEQADRAEAYEEYRRRVVELCAWDSRFTGVLPIVHAEHLHQAEMTRRALDLARTPLVLFVEHDTYPHGEIDWPGLFRVASREDVDAVRLHIFDRVMPEHVPLYGQRREVDGVPVIPTRQWSQRPHLAKASWYRRMIAELFAQEDRTMIEDRVHGLADLAAGAAPWRMFVYAPEGDMTRSGTSDGRRVPGTDTWVPKYPMLWGGEWRG